MKQALLLDGGGKVAWKVYQGGAGMRGLCSATEELGKRRLSVKDLWMELDYRWRGW